MTWFARRGHIHTDSSHTFHLHSIGTWIKQWYMCAILPNVKRCFYLGFFLKTVWYSRVPGWSLNGSGELYIDSQPIDMGSFCVNQNTSRPHLRLFDSVKFLNPYEPATLWLPISYLPPLQKCLWYWPAQEVNYLKWQAVQLAIQCCTVDTMNYLEQL